MKRIVRQEKDLELLIGLIRLTVATSAGHRAPEVGAAALMDIDDKSNKSQAEDVSDSCKHEYSSIEALVSKCQMDPCHVSKTRQGHSLPLKPHTCRSRIQGLGLTILRQVDPLLQ